MWVNKDTIYGNRKHHMEKLLSLIIIFGFITGALAIWMVMSSYLSGHDYAPYYSTMLVYADMEEKPIEGGYQARISPKYKSKDIEKLKVDVEDRNLVETWIHHGKHVSITVKTDLPVNNTMNWGLTTTYGAEINPASIVRTSRKNVYTMDFGNMKTIWGNTKLGNLEYRGKDPYMKHDDRGINILEDYGKFVQAPR